MPSFGDPGAYPIPGAVTSYGIGPPWLKMHQFQPDYKAVTNVHSYEDGGASFVTFNDTAPILWTIEYDGLDGGSALDHGVLDTHRGYAFGEVYSFSFFNPYDNVTYTDVHYDRDFEEDHKKIWINKRIVHLIKRPA